MGVFVCYNTIIFKTDCKQHMKENKLCSSMNKGDK